jgi:DNA-binding transcriptional MerR regulator
MLMTIATAAKQAGLTPGTLRVYERLGLLSPQRDSTGRRLFSNADVQLARRVAADRRAARAEALVRAHREISP